MRVGQLSSINHLSHPGANARARLDQPPTFSHLCQHCAGHFNFDPNFGHGTNERVVSALADGIPVANNFNLRTDHLTGCTPYRFTDASIRHAAERLLAYCGEVPLPAGNTWEYMVCELLGAIAADSSFQRNPVLFVRLSTGRPRV